MPPAVAHAGLVRAANEARDAADRAKEDAIAACNASKAAGGEEQAAAARKEAEEALATAKCIQDRLTILDQANEAAKAALSTARMEASRCKEALARAQENAESSKETLRQLEAALEAARGADAKQNQKTAQVEGEATAAWEQAAACTAAATEARTAAEKAADDAVSAAREMASAQARRTAAEKHVVETEALRAEAVAAVSFTEQAALEKEQEVEKLNSSGIKGAKAVWMKTKAVSAAGAAREAADEASAKAQLAVRAADEATIRLQQAVDAEGPLVESAAEKERLKLEALETASKVELEAKGADAVARKAESQARAARVAQQAAEMKVAREEGAKESGDEALAKAISEAETIESRLAVAITKEENCAEAANAAKMAMEAKRAELADAQALATQLEELAVAAEAREQHRIDTEETAKQLEEEAKEALAASRGGGTNYRGNLTVAAACKLYGDGLSRACLGQRASFMIEACDASGKQQSGGGDAFLVIIRYSALGTTVHAQLKDHDDGTYDVKFKPTRTGRCSISITLAGQPLPGSPFTCIVHSPLPCASQCLVDNERISKLVAGQRQNLNVGFRNEQGTVAPYVDLDVFVQPAEAQSAAIATGGNSAETSPPSPPAPISLLAFDSLVVGHAPIEVTRTVEADSEVIGRLQPGRVLRVAKVEAQGDEGMIRACVSLENEGDRSGNDSWRETYVLQQSWRADTWRATANAIEREAEEKAKAVAAVAAQARAAEEAAMHVAAVKAAMAKVEEKARAKAMAKSEAEAEAARLLAEEEAAKEATRLKVEAEAEAAALAEKMAAKNGKKSKRNATPQKPVVAKPIESSPSRGGGRRSNVGTTSGAPAADAPSPKKSATSSGGKKGKKNSEDIAAKRAAEKDRAAMRLQAARRGLVARRQVTLRKEELARTTAVARDRCAETQRRSKFKDAEFGWVTASTKDATYATLHVPRLLAAERQQHIKSWRILLDNERARQMVLARDENMSDLSQEHSLSYLKQRRAKTTDDVVDVGVHAGWGFAYGGISPGRSAPGADSHMLAFSVAQAGVYRLHVNLRSEAMPLRGSPFLIHVAPGSAHALMTHIPRADLPLRGCLDVVERPAAEPSNDPKSSSAPDLTREGTISKIAPVKADDVIPKREPSATPYVCRYSLTSRDKLGNACDAGGATVTCGFLGRVNGASSSVDDMGNGAYKVQFFTAIPGEFAVFIKLDGLHVMGSPALMQMTDEPPPPGPRIDRKPKTRRKARTSRSPAKRTARTPAAHQ